MAQKIAKMPEHSDEEEDDVSDATLDESSEGEGTHKASLLAQQAAVQAANQAQATRRPFLQEGEAATGLLAHSCMTSRTWTAGLSYCTALPAQAEEGLHGRHRQAPIATQR